MIGNDLVYLPTWPQREGGRLQRFRTKVFTEAEREFITSAENPHLAEAWLWSCKEAAYKVWFKRSLKREFAPKKFKVETQAPLDLDADRSVSIKAQAPLGLDADRSVCIKTQAPLSLDADRSVSIKTQASLSLDADRSVCIEGRDASSAWSQCRPQRLHLRLGQESILKAFGEDYFLLSRMKDNYIHTLASDQSFAELGKVESWRGHIRPKSLNYQQHTLIIEKDEHLVPFGNWQGQRLDFSLSHDGAETRVFWLAPTNG